MCGREEDGAGVPIHTCNDINPTRVEDCPACVLEYDPRGSEFRPEEFGLGTCDTCGEPYDVSSRDGRCGDCGECAQHCTHEVLLVE